MAKRKSDYTEILVRQGIISPEQLAEGQQVVAQSGTSLPEALTKLGYATGEEVMRAMAEQHGLDYVNLAEVSIPPSVVELVPESVARENVAIPLSESDGKLTVIVSDPMDYDTFDKLRFILNRQIEIALAPREAILEAINRHYGQTVGEMPTRCCRSSPTRPSTSPRPCRNRRPARRKWTRAAPRWCGWCNW